MAVRRLYPVPALVRPFAVPGYPYAPLLGLALAVLCLGALVYYNPGLSGIFWAACWRFLKRLAVSCWRLAFLQIAFRVPIAGSRQPAA